MQRAVQALLKQSDPVMRAESSSALGHAACNLGRLSFTAWLRRLSTSKLNGKAAETIFKRFTALAG